MLGLLLAVSLGAGPLPGFPREAGGAVAHPAVAVVLDGAPAALVAAGDRVAAVRADGGAAGFPIRLPEGDAAAGAPAAADMDGDHRPEVAAVATSGTVLLWSGGVLPGWPVKLGARARAGAAFADVDGDGRPELVVGDEKGRLHAFERSGARARGFPVQLGAAPITSSAASADFAGGLSLAVGAEDGKVHVVDGKGRPRKGFPAATAFAVTGAPAFADLDGDGAMDLLVASQDFKLHALSAAGEPLAGFPVAAGYRLYEGPAVADLDGDGRLDVAFASADGMLHAVDGAGKPLAGFPVRVGSRSFGGPAVGDLDLDGSPELVVVTSDGHVAAVGRGGRPAAGFPVSLGEAEVTASPLVVDLARDGGPAVVVGAPSGRVHAVQASRAGTAKASVPWPGPGRDAARTGRYGPNPPVYRDLTLEPAEPRVADALAAGWRATWLDAGPGEQPPAPRITWLRDGKPVPAAEGQRTLAPGTARRGERWRFALSAPGGGPEAVGPEVRVLDTAPTAPALQIDPPSPARGQAVRAAVSRPSSDADGDPVTYRIDWLEEGLETGVIGDTFPGDRLRHGYLVTARAVASDGELRSPPGLADVRVANTAPGAPQAVTLSPAAPRRTDAVRAEVARPAVDADGEPVAYRHRWLVDGKPLPLPAAAAEVPAGLARKHQVLQVEVRAFDGDAEGPPAVAQVTVANSPPSAPRVEVRPARPRKGEPLRATVLAPAEDADGDPIAYDWAWTRNGAPLAVAGDPRVVPGADVGRDDRFEVTVRASDGEASGPPATAAAAAINTPPEPPRIAIEPRHPAGGQPIELRVVQPARDRDGDPVELQVAWIREGKPIPTRGLILPPGTVKKHERVRAEVTPRDGREAGPVVLDEVVVENAPPGAPVVGFSSARPQVTAPLRATVRTPAPDADGDPLSYAYRWTRNGAPVSLPGAESRADGWTTAAEVPVGLLAKGDTWDVEVRAFDGEAHGPIGRASVVVANSPPPPPQVTLSPERPRRVDGVAAVLRQPPDPDGDRVTHRFAWNRNGQRVEAPPDRAAIPRATLRKGERWGVEVVALDGEAESEPARAEVSVGDTAPGPVTLALCGGPVQSGAVPEVRVVTPSADADGDAVAYGHEWSLGGVVQRGATGARFPRPLRKHEEVRVRVTPWDGELAGPVAEAACLARNTAPTAPVAVLEPASPTALTGLAVRIQRPATDHDGDQVSYRYRWTRDGLAVALDGPAAPPRTLRHREAWRVEVVPFDGEEAGEAVVLEATVANTPPPTPAVVVKPLNATAGAALSCEATVPDRDADQEPLTIRYRWYRNGRQEALSEGEPAVPAGVVRRGERWRCEAWSTDGTAESAPAVAEVTVQNGPPSPPQLVIEPDPARTADTLGCRVAVPSVDPDGDPVGYTFAWWKNEKPLQPSADPARLPDSATVRGDRVRCAATPSDGSLPGPAATAELTIANTAPGPARVRVTPASPRAGQPIRCEVAVKAADADGDRLRYRFRWQKNGAAQPFAETSDEVPARMLKEGDRWRCLAVATDGDQDGPESGSEEAQVGPGP